MPAVEFALQLKGGQRGGGRKQQGAEQLSRRGGAPPDRDDANWMKHTLAWFEDTGKVTIEYRPVHDYTMTNDVQYIPPMARVY